jgi:alcohol dehydrogenase (cytochrome c)
VVATAVAVAVGGLAAVGQGAANKAGTAKKAEAIVPAPAFTAADLAKLPTDNWPTNGGSTMNQRYSPLTEINAGNVAKLKGVWRTHLRGRALAAKYSGESQPIVYKGTLYVTSGDDDVFAVSVKTGKILWEHRGNLNQKISTVCCGWLNRGVALGNGLVYYNRLDGWTQALDQQTGKVVWAKHIVKWQAGQTMTQAPLYMDGKIFIGVVGADFGTRSFMDALDAKTGKQIWRWYSIPGPKDPGGDTWPKTGNMYLRGGGAVWSTPSYDANLGLLYISTGNAGSDWFGGDRAGKNLYACSIVALDVKTGKVKWYFQEVHHDIWDYDAPSPVVLFDSTANGKTVKGLGQPGKTGWLYLLDRATGKPLYGIDEKPVPQNAEQKTWPTQPIPRTGAFIPHTTPSAAEIARVKKERDPKVGAKVPLVVAEKMFTPPTTKAMLVYSPGPQGGNNWMPSSYNQKTNMFYVCAANQTVGVLSARNTFKQGQSYAGIGAIAGIGFNESPGTFTAIDAGSGKVVWQKTWAKACYSGTVSTAGNLVFVGRNSGLLQAYNATDGKLLWSWQTGAGANNTPAIFQQDGHQYVAFFSAGNSLAATPHGDDLWLLGLNGTLGPSKGTGIGAGTEHAGEGNTSTPAKGDAVAGKVVFSANCGTCHGSLGTGGNGGPDLTQIPAAKNLTAAIKQVTNGGGGMPAFKGQLTAKQIRDVATYVANVVAQGKAK